VKGDPLRSETIAEALPGHDAVLSAIGPHPRDAFPAEHAARGLRAGSGAGHGGDQDHAARHRLRKNYSKNCMLALAIIMYVGAPMPNAEQRFKSLAAEFEALAARMRVCRDPELRLALLRQMKLLIDEIDGLVFTSVNRDKTRAVLTHPRLIPEA